MTERSHKRQRANESRASGGFGIDVTAILEALTVPQLRHLAKECNLSATSNMKRAELLRTFPDHGLNADTLLESMCLEHLCVVADALDIGISRRSEADAIVRIKQRLQDRRHGRLDHNTAHGKYYLGDSGAVLQGDLGKSLVGKVNLILTSPPFPLNKKKKYGNLSGDQYRQWLSQLAPVFSRLLAPDGSVVIELGNAWESKRPVQSLLHLHSLIDFVENPEADLRLCQQFACYNPARLPGPAQWVTIERIRVTDSFTQVWWMAKSDRPKANNRRVLRPYSERMSSLLKRGRYNSGGRPSEHEISETGFLTDHGGSIMPNLLELESSDPNGSPRLPESMLRFANTQSNDEFHRRCQASGLTPHPARMPAGLAGFFVEFLTEPGDLVLDPFAGSNTTGYVAEAMDRRWVAVEADAHYAQQARLRFAPENTFVNGE